MLNVRNLDPGYCVATWDRVLIQQWRGPATLEAAQQWLVLGEEFIKESGGQPCSNLSIVESSSPPPSEKVRRALSASFRGLAAGMHHQIVVAEGSAFRTALVRAVGLTLSTLSSSSLPLKFVVSLDEAALTLAPDLSAAAGGAAGLKSAIMSLRSHLDNYIQR